jgi:hypothetical protein
MAISGDDSAAFSVTSSPLAFVVLDRPSRLVDCVDKHPSRPNFNSTLLLVYHTKSIAINNYVEAERRTIPAKR